MTTHCEAMIKIKEEQFKLNIALSNEFCTLAETARWAWSRWVWLKLAKVFYRKASNIHQELKIYWSFFTPIAETQAPTDPGGSDKNHIVQARN